MWCTVMGLYIGLYNNKLAAKLLTRRKVYLYTVNNTNTMHIDSLNGLWWYLNYMRI